MGEGRKGVMKAAVSLGAAVCLLLAGCEKPESGTTSAEVVPPEVGRRAPLRQIEAKVFLSAGDFGAVPDDGRDDTAAIQAAIQAVAAAAEPARLTFAPGQYDLISSEGKGSLLDLRNLTDADLDGTGARFVIHAPGRGFMSITDCHRLIVRGLTLDWDPKPYSELWIEEVDAAASTILFRLREGATPPDHPVFLNGTTLAGGNLAFWGNPVLTDPRGRMKPGAPITYEVQSVEALGDGKFRIAFNNAPSHFEPLAPGDAFVLIVRGISRSGVTHIEESSDVTFADMEILASSGGVFVGVGVEALNVLRVKALIPADRWNGPNADFVHMQTTRVGPWVEDCVIEGVRDDSLVIYTRPYVLLSQPAPDRLMLRRVDLAMQASSFREGQMEPGDELAFLDPVKGEVFARAKITGFDLKTGEAKLDRAVDGIQPLSEKKNATQIFNTMHGRGFYLKNNTIRDTRRYGAYIKGSHGLIEGNHFIGQSSDGITLHNDPAPPNGPTSSDIVIRNNSFEDVGHDRSYRGKEHAANISVYCRANNMKPGAGSDAFRNIRIEGNAFTRWGGLAIWVSNTKGLVISGNRLLGPPSAAAGIEVEHVQDFESADNQWQDGSLVEIRRPSTNP